jgi:hypothetical protein
MQIKPIALAAALAVAAPLAGAGNISYAVTPIVIQGAGQARSLNDQGEVAVWARSLTATGYVPNVWTGGTVEPVDSCCVSNPLADTPLFIDDTGRVTGQQVVPFVALRGFSLDRSTGISSDLGAGFVPTGRGAGGRQLVQLNGIASVVSGSSVTPLPLPAGPGATPWPTRWLWVGWRSTAWAMQLVFAGASQGFCTPRLQWPMTSMQAINGWAL